jgi:ABC-type nitrate/sulfonate/bicarbonate transport system, permease component
MYGRLVYFFEKSFVILIVIVTWELIPRLNLADSFILPPFSTVVGSLIKLLLSGELLVHLWASLQRATVGFLLAAILGVPLGVAMGWFAKVERMIDPLFQILRNTSVLAMFPIFILVFGLGEASKTAIIFWGSLWPVLINSIDGVKNIEPILIKAARSMGVANFTLFRKVILPAVVPSILTGLRLSAGMSVIILVAAEMVGANRGLGFYIFYEQQKYEVPQMYAGIVTIALLGFLVNYLLIRLEKYLTKWKEQVAR